MALLNFATSYSDVADKLTLPQSDTGDYIKLYFTKDGHIITHGIDYIPWGIGQIPISKLPIDNTQASSDYLWDSATIQDKINASFVANDAMRFKGTIGLTSINNYTINGDAADFPSKTAVVGDTYRVVTAGNYAGSQCEVGDLLICIKADPTGENTAWTVAQTNINGQIQHNINGVPRNFYSNDSQSFNIFAPIVSGAATQVLISNGPKTNPIWANQSDIVAGGLTDESKKALFTSMIYSDNTLTVAIGGTSKSVIINSGRAVQVNNTEVLAASANTALNLTNGIGTTFIWDSVNNAVKLNVNTDFTTDIVNKNYAVKVDSNNQLYVNIPQANTYTVVSNISDGLAPKVINTNTDLINREFYLLASSDGQATPSWYKLPTEFFVNTWRTIKVGGTSIEDKSLNFVPTGDIYVKVVDQDTTTEDEFDIGFGLAWYNVNTGKYEYE